MPVVISVHGDMVLLCHSHKSIASQEPDHEEKTQEDFRSKQQHINEEDADIKGDHPGQVHPLLLDNKIETIPLEIERQQGWLSSQELFVLVIV